VGDTRAIRPGDPIGKHQMSPYQNMIPTQIGPTLIGPNPTLDMNSATVNMLRVERTGQSRFAIFAACVARAAIGAATLVLTCLNTGQNNTFPLAVLAHTLKLLL
jgi:hypothetical protein